jgi:hypothetical protein
MLLHEKLAVCHTSDTPRLTGCRCGSCFERKMPESTKNAVATAVLTHNNRELHGSRNRCQRFENCDALAEHMIKSRVPAPKITVSLVVSDPSQLRRGGHGDPNKSGRTLAITGQTNIQQFPRLTNSPSDKPKKIQNENRRRSTPLCCQIARIGPPEVSQNVLSSPKSSR